MPKLRRLSRYLGLWWLPIFTSVGCATERTIIRSQPPGATVTINNRLFGVTPAFYTVRRSDWPEDSFFNCQLELEGYAPADCSFSGQRRQNIMGDISTLGIARIFRGAYVLKDEQNFTLQRLSGTQLSALRRSQPGETVMPPSSPPHLPGPRWKGIRIGESTRSDLDERFGTGMRDRAGHVAYTVAGNLASVTFGDGNVVLAVEVSPSIKLVAADVKAAYGPPERQTLSDFIQIWEFDRRGITVRFGKNNEAVNTVEFHVPGISPPPSGR